MNEAELTAYVLSKPSGINTRRIWFLYEFLTGRQLAIPDLQSTCGYVDVLGPDDYVTRPGKRLLCMEVTQCTLYLCSHNDIMSDGQRDQC